MRDGTTRYPRNDRSDRLLHGRIQMVRRAVRELSEAIRLFYADEAIEARPIRKLIDDAVASLNEARDLVLEEVRLKYEAGTVSHQEALFDEDPQGERR